MAVRYLLDTNVVLHFLGGRLSDPLPAGEYCISVITEIELLSYPLLDEKAEKQIRTLISNFAILDLTQEIKELTIQLRKNSVLKMPDAIIAASAIASNAELLTNDQRLLKTMGLKSQSVPLKQ
ncbi:MAG: type II toxin-antitoxin system VapC family toxin [Candidatus Sumerlaeota bacterium]|nr:type II toxin-antitoxin system VapC family toxin [Candidatus Sumerlaeota bacterium]